MDTPDFPIIDAHIHLFIDTPLAAPEIWTSRLSPVEAQYMRQRFDENLKSRGQMGVDYTLKTPTKFAEKWLAEFKKHNISQGVFITFDPEMKAMRNFLKLGKGKFIGFAFLNPLDGKGPEILKKAVREWGLKGLKLVSTNQKFHPSDERIYPLYEAAQELNIPILMHMGVSIGYNADFRFANPLYLQPAARDFPDLYFVLPHFGTGFFREALLLAYQCDNVYYDTSSSNVWIKYQGYPLTIRDVFERALDAAGPERIIFGTDSSYFPRGFREDIYKEQKSALESLGISDDDQAKIFGGNIKRLLDGVRS